MYEKLHSFTWLDGMLAAGLALMTVGIGLNIKIKMDENKMKVIRAQPTVIVAAKVTAAPVKFEVAGEVLRPGVYQLSKGSRIDEALMVAGGLSLKADRDWVERYINRAAIVVDGSKIYIPKLVTSQELRVMNQNKIEKNPEQNRTGVIAGASTVININTAGVEELDKLPGVGPAVAAKIIEYREKNGSFKAIAEIKSVSGIGDAMYEKIKDLIEI